jgi:hypothetical protein
VGLPQLTVGSDARTADVVSRLDRWGVCVIERLLGDREAEALAAQLEVAAAEADLPSPFTGAGGEGLDTHPVTLADEGGEVI